MTSKMERVCEVMTEREAQKKLFRTFLYLPVPLVLFIVGGCWLGVRFGHPAIGSGVGVFLGILVLIVGVYVIFISGHKSNAG